VGLGAGDRGRRNSLALVADELCLARALLAR
jgi:hypothetical protein